MEPRCIILCCIHCMYHTCNGCNKDGHGTWESVPPSDVIAALSIMYPPFWLEQGHKDKLTCYMTILKATFGHLRNISSVSLVYGISPTILNIAALDQRLRWFAVAMVSSSKHTMHAIHLHVHPITKHWCNLAQQVHWKKCFWSFLS